MMGFNSDFVSLSTRLVDRKLTSLRRTANGDKNEDYNNQDVVSTRVSLFSWPKVISYTLNALLV